MNRAWSVSFTHNDHSKTVTVIAASMFSAINIVADRYRNCDVLRAQYLGHALFDGDEPE